MLNLLTSPANFRFMLLFVCIVITNLSGCREKPPTPQEGDIVVWKHNSELIIKAKLGQRREHVIVDPRTDHFFYEPEYEKFIGQFPIDYKPKPFPKFTEQEQIEFEADWGAKVHAVKSGHPIQFNLMLNGVTAKATDEILVSEKALDNINQVKVELRSHGIRSNFLTTQDYYSRFSKLTAPEMWHFDKQSSDEYDMKCYKHNEIKPLSKTKCFGSSIYEKSSGVIFTNVGTNWVFGRSYESIYGGIEVVYRIDRRKLKHWKEVDAAIWHLLERWNISPLRTNVKN